MCNIHFQFGVSKDENNSFGTHYQFHLQGLDVKYEVLHPALEDGTDRGFRKVGKPQSDAGEIPKRIHTRFKTQRKFEIKNESNSLIEMPLSETNS